MDFSHPSKMLANCPMCQALYDEKEIRLLGERGVTRLFHCTCHACGHAMLAVILETQGAISSVGLVTDLEAQDAIRFKDLQPLRSEDCLTIHRLLKRHSAEFCRALSQETKPKI